MDVTKCNALLMMGLLFAVAGCNSSENTQQATGAEAPDQPKQKEALAILFHRGSGPFNDALRDGVSSAAEQYDIQVEFMEAGPEDVDEQITLLTAAIKERFRGICLYPLDGAVADLMATAEDSGIPVVTFGRDVGADVKVVSHAATDQFHAGRAMAEHLVTRLDDDAVILLLDCEADVDSVTRRSGFAYAAEKELEKFEIVHVPCSADPADDVQESLDEHDDVAAVVGFNVATSRAALAAAEAAELIVCGYGAWDGAQAAIRDGSLQATLLEDPYMIGFSAVMAMSNHLSGEESVGEFITAGEHVITAENLDDPTAARLLESNRTGDE